MRPATIGAVVGIVLGLMLAFAGGVMAVVAWTVDDDTTPPEDGIATTAEIVDWVEGSALIGGIARPTYAPVYEYRDLTGQVHRVVDRTSTESRPPRVGSEVEISYVEGSPESVRRTDLDRRWVGWLAAVGLGMVALGLLIAVGSGAVGLAAARRTGVDPAAS